MTATLSPLLAQATAVVVDRAMGSTIHGTDGREYLDFTSGIAVTSTGHCHPHVTQAITSQAHRVIHAQYTTVMHPGLVTLTQRLGEYLPTGLDSVFYASAGSEVVEAAIRLSRQATGRTNLVVFQGGFHGRTSGALSLTTSKTAYRAGVQPLLPGVFVTPFPDATRFGRDEARAIDDAMERLEELLLMQSAPDETAAIVVEPILGEGGYLPAPIGFLPRLRSLADQHGILLVLDEIQTGYGRTGRFWGLEHDAVVPDILLAAKGIASGMPLSAMWAKTDLMARGRPGSQGGTYGGNAVAVAAALATLDVIEDEGLVDNARIMGGHLMEGLQDLARRHPVLSHVRGRGLMIGTVFSTPDGTPDSATATRLRGSMEDHGVLLLKAGPHGNVIRWAPPLVVTSSEVDRALAMFAECLEDLPNTPMTNPPTISNTTGGR